MANIRSLQISPVALALQTDTQRRSATVSNLTATTPLVAS